MMQIDSEEYRIFWSLSDTITCERKGLVPVPIELAELYVEFKQKYFSDSVPQLSEEFVCVYQELPFDIAGASLLGEDATKLGVKPGIRINEKFGGFVSETKVALLHEMIHATGLRGHEAGFVAFLVDLFGRGAYTNPRII
jgi:hypothetical protein